MDGQLRPPVASRKPPFLAPNLLATARAVDEPVGTDRLVEQPGQQTEGIQFPHRVGQQVYPDSQRTDLANGLVHVDLETGRVQAQSGSQSADAGTDDRDPGWGDAHWLRGSRELR